MFDFSTAPVTLSLIIVNVAVSLYALFVDQRIIDNYAFKPERVRRHGEAYRMITSAFLHANLPHLLFNMITLYFFGPTIEVLLGVVPFLIIYVGSALTASIWPLYKYAEEPDYAAVGASGSIAGVLFAHCLFFPLNKLYIFFIPIGIPAVIFAIAFVAFSYYASNKPDAGPSIFGKIAHEAHLGGAIGGLLITILIEPRSVQIFFGELLRLVA